MPYEKSKMGMSIATGLAIESLMGYDEEGNKVKETESLHNTGRLYINLRTLIRNHHGSLSKDFRLEADVKDIHDGVVRDIILLKGQLKDATSDRMEIVIYFKKYDDLHKTYPYARQKEPRTAIQLAYRDLEDGTARSVIKAQDDGDYSILQTKLSIPELFGRIEGGTGMMTHYPVDLLDPNLDRLGSYLLESHTGEIRMHDRWYTKLKGDRAVLVHIPFNYITLQLFGDSGGMFNSYPLPVRKQFIDLATQIGWTSRTTVRRMRREVMRYATRFPLLKDVVNLF